jgi:molybdopterin-binding protein
VGLLAGQPLVAEVTGQAAAELGLRPGMRVWAAWKATATRLASAQLTLVALSDVK